MIEYVVVLNSATSGYSKLVRLYMCQNGEYRQYERTVNMAVDVEGYIPAHIDELWEAGSPLPEHEWLAATARSFGGLYQDVAVAAVKAARKQGSTLADVTAAMEAVIEDSADANKYAWLKQAAASATAAQRDNFFLVLAYLALGESAGK